MEYPATKQVLSRFADIGMITCTPLFYFDALDTSIPQEIFLKANTEFRKLLGFFTTHALEYKVDDSYPGNTVEKYCTKFIVYAAEKKLNPDYPNTVEFDSKKIQDFLKKYPFTKLPE